MKSCWMRSVLALTVAAICMASVFSGLGRSNTISHESALKLVAAATPMFSIDMISQEGGGDCDGIIGVPHPNYVDDLVYGQMTDFPCPPGCKFDQVCAFSHREIYLLQLPIVDDTYQQMRCKCEKITDPKMREECQRAADNYYIDSVAVLKAELLTGFASCCQFPPVDPPPTDALITS